jgi:peptide/nickel transport system ATP-binding protein
VRAVDGVSFDVGRDERFGLVGESGCGKSTTAMTLLRLIRPPGKIVGGQVTLGGADLLKLNDSEMRAVRWKRISLIMQGAMNSLNPTMRVRDQIIDAIEAHQTEAQSRKALEERVTDLLAMVQLPHRVSTMYPHELSGGMKQRVCIAMAIALNPSLLIADEPTSALDVVVQRVVAQTLLEVKARLNVSMILIGHDMGLQAQLVDRLAVMYAGNIVEIAPVKEAFEESLHPYTQLLIASIPSIKKRKPLKVTAGLTHDLRNPPPGCIFHFRCPHVMDRCREIIPPLRELKPEHHVACYLYE